MKTKKLLWIGFSSIVLCAIQVIIMAQVPDWQMHSKWCAVIDHGSSNAVYLTTCASHDQFDSVIACQNDARNGPAVDTIRQATRGVVNTFMDNYKPTSCQ